jgi:hypothetical protein
VYETNIYYIIIIQSYLKILRLSQVRFCIVRSRTVLGHFGFWIIQVRILGHLISDHLGFRIIWVRDGSGWFSSGMNLGSSWISSCPGSGRVKFWALWSWVVPNFRSSRVGFGSIWLSKKIRSGWVKFCHIYPLTTHIISTAKRQGQL